MVNLIIRTTVVATTFVQEVEADDDDNYNNAIYCRHKV